MIPTCHSVPHNFLLAILLRSNAFETPDPTPQSLGALKVHPQAHKHILGPEEELGEVFLFRRMCAGHQRVPNSDHTPSYTEHHT